MSLDEYRRKRDFKKTPEPAPAPAQKGGNRFYIQRHSATRLHYDLRLEMDGVLKSWAVPKGPTLDPAEKRLAVLVEDHPLEYGDFEGTIPAGEYGAGSVMVWDRGTYEWLTDKTPAEQWAAGDLKFRLHGEKLLGEFALVRMKNRGRGNEWLLLKKKDFAAVPGWDAENDLRSVHQGTADPSRAAGAVKAPMPDKLSPMLAVIGTTLPEGPEWVYEVKWDGVRSLCFVEKDKVRLISRTGKAMERQYPELAALAQALNAASAIVDGEIVAFDEQGRPSFAKLQPRIGANPKAVPQLARMQPVTLFAFDLLYLDGYDLRGCTLEDRKRLLASALRPSPVVRYSEHFVGKGQQLLDSARQTGLEGVVAKKGTSKYESRRSDCWVKLKVVSQQDFVICGFTKGAREFGALVLGYYEDKRLLWAGNVGTGFDQASLKALHRTLSAMAVKRSPFAESHAELKSGITWVRPELVCSVKFTMWTPDLRLRAPVFLGLRPDAEARDCVREDTAGGGARSTAGEGAGATGPGEGGGRATTQRRTAGLSPAVSGASSPAAPPHLLEGKQEEVFLEVEGRRLKFTHLNKVFYPRESYRKRDVVNYYDAVAGLILPHLQDRPLSLKRYPDGIEGEYFFQKEAGKTIAPWLRTEPIEDEKKTTNFVVCDDRASLLYLANLGCIDQNPWMSRVGTLHNPDFILIDLDPYHCEYDRIVQAAQLVRQKLEQIGLAGYPKTTGGDGMHIYIPIEPVYSYEHSKTFAEILSRLLAAERPDLFTTPRTVAKREKGKVYFDFLQNGEGKTISAPYVLRAYPGAPVATPLSWREVAPGLSPKNFHLGNVVDRFARVGDLFQPVLTKLQRIEGALEKLGRLVRDAHLSGRGS